MHDHASAKIRTPEGEERVIDLQELADILAGNSPFNALNIRSGQFVHAGADEDDIDLDLDDDSAAEEIDEQSLIFIDTVNSSTRFRWMEEFVESVYSVPARTALIHALHKSHPFRNFKDILRQYSEAREHWFAFENEKLIEEAVAYLKSVDLTILEVTGVKPRCEQVHQDPLARFLTDDERDWILKGAWEISGLGGRTQLARMLKGSTDKRVISHNLQLAPAYGSLAHLTIEEIEARIDQLVREDQLVIVMSGRLPMICIDDTGSLRIQDWALQRRVQVASEASEKELDRIVRDWANRKKSDKWQILDTIEKVRPPNAAQILDAWFEVSGREMRERIDDVRSRLETRL